MRVLSIIGARPQFIKEAVLHQELKKRGIEEILVNSDQHYDHNMSSVFFNDFGIRSPDYNMGIGSGQHGEMTGRIMIDFEKIVMREKPDWVIVYGDTNTTLAGAIVAAKLKIPIAHVEAGVRMLPKSMPEEINRTLTDKISTLLLCASHRSVANLQREGILEGVHCTGDVMYDLFLHLKPKFKFEVNLRENLSENEYCVVTLHRDYNVDSRENLEPILKQLGELAMNCPVVFPMHPRTRKRIDEFGLRALLGKVTVTEPIDYLNLMGLVSKCRFVATDSGGLQKEAYYAGKPAILFMQDPAWHELVEEKVNTLVGPKDILSDLVPQLKINNFKEGIYGNGDSSRMIVDLLIQSGS